MTQSQPSAVKVDYQYTEKQEQYTFRFLGCCVALKYAAVGRILPPLIWNITDELFFFFFFYPKCIEEINASTHKSNTQEFIFKSNDENKVMDQT